MAYEVLRLLNAKMYEESKNAKKYIYSDPDASINKTNKILEAYSKDLYKSLTDDEDDRPKYFTIIDELANGGYITDAQRSNLHSIRQRRNKEQHDSRDMGAKFAQWAYETGEEIVETLIEAMNSAPLQNLQTKKETDKPPAVGVSMQDQLTYSDGNLKDLKYFKAEKRSARAFKFSVFGLIWGMIYSIMLFSSPGALIIGDMLAVVASVLGIVFGLTGKKQSAMLKMSTSKATMAIILGVIGCVGVCFCVIAAITVAGRVNPSVTAAMPMLCVNIFY